VESLIWFLNSTNFRPAKIHRQIVKVYGEGTMNKGNARKWCRLFKDGRTNMHEEEWSKHALHEHLKQVIFEHPPDSPDLAPSDYNLFLHLKKLLPTRIWGVTKRQKTPCGTFFDEGIQKLDPRYDKCLNLHGDYMEKYFNVGTNILQWGYL
jgi:hypothetical protein